MGHRRHSAPRRGSLAYLPRGRAKSMEARIRAWPKVNSDEPILIVFGTTNKGIYDILGTDIKKIQNAKIFNFFPNQATQTVRLEEAILGVLSIINILNYNYIK